MCAPVGSSYCQLSLEWYPIGYTLGRGLVNCLRKRPGSIFVREVADGLLLLDMEAARIHQLNATAGFIWRQCDGVTSAADIAAAVEKEYEVEQGAAARDVEMALMKLRELDLVVEGEIQ
jgi:hypothetical protein